MEKIIPIPKQISVDGMYIVMQDWVDKELIYKYENYIIVRKGISIEYFTV